ncbi:tetratricopeptide repeat protein [Rhodococcus koreensis]|nr:tetratricopeptide repeat protein [Rhodococcus koreensis]
MVISHARARLECALGLFERRRDAPPISVLHFLGVAYEQLGETERTIAQYQQLLAVTTACGESVYRSYTLRAMAIVTWRQGKPARASELIEQALRLSRQVNNPRTTARASRPLPGWSPTDRTPRVPWS